MHIEIVNTRTKTGVDNVLDYSSAQRDELHNAIISKFNLDEEITDAALLANIKPFLSYVAQWFSYSYTMNSLSTSKVYSPINKIELLATELSASSTFSVTEPQVVTPAKIPFSNSEIIIATKTKLTASTGEIQLRTSDDVYISVLNDTFFALTDIDSVTHGSALSSSPAKEIVWYFARNTDGQLRATLYVNKSRVGQTGYLKANLTDFCQLKLRELNGMKDFIVFSGADLSSMIGASGDGETTIQNTDFNTLMSYISAA